MGKTPKPQNPKTPKPHKFHIFYFILIIYFLSLMSFSVKQPQPISNEDLIFNKPSMDKDGISGTKINPGSKKSEVHIRIKPKKFQTYRDTRANKETVNLKINT
jgi:hypothetical protein